MPAHAICDPMRPFPSLSCFAIFKMKFFLILQDRLPVVCLPAGNPRGWAGVHQGNWAVSAWPGSLGFNHPSPRGHKVPGIGSTLVMSCLQVLQKRGPAQPAARTTERSLLIRRQSFRPPPCFPILLPLLYCLVLSQGWSSFIQRLDVEGNWGVSSVMLV